MAVYTIPKMEYARFESLEIKPEFTGGDITSDIDNRKTVTKLSVAVSSLFFPFNCDEPHGFEPIGNRMFEIPTYCC